MKLIEEGKLSLDDRVFGDGGILENRQGTLTYSQNEKSITVEHLLTHTAGGKAWDNAYSFLGISDPMFSLKGKGMSQESLIDRVLDTRDPDGLPGTRFSYSNFAT